MSNPTLLRSALLAVAAIGVVALLTVMSFFTRDALAQTEPTVESVEVTAVTDSTADITVTITNPDSSVQTVNLRYRTPRGTGDWVTATPLTTGTTTRDFTLGSLTTNSSYEVQASVNDPDFGTGSRYAVFKTHGPPSNLRLNVAPADQQLTLSWTVSLNGGTVSSQTVEWKLSTETSFSGTVTPANDARSHTIQNLTNDTAYTVKVTVTTNYGSDDVEVSGREPVSGPSLSDLTFPTVTRTSATARVSVNNATSATTVKLRYRVKGTTDWSATATRTVNGGIASFPLSGLTGYTRYEVEASLSADFQASLVRDLLTAKSTPGPPESVTISDGDSMLDLSWAPPTNDGGEPISGYVVQWKSDGQSYDTARRIQIGSNVLPEAQITGLTNGTEYTVRIFATNRLGSGIGVEVEGTPGTIPESPPTSVTAAACDVALHLSWRPPANDGGSPVTSYVIQWKSGTQAYDPSTREEQRPTADTSFTLTSLQTTTEYTVRVAALNDKVDTTSTDYRDLLQWGELSAMTRSGTCLTELRFGNPLAASVPAYVTVEDALADTVIYLRYRPDGASSWVSTLTATPGAGSSTVTFDITDLTSSTRYEVETSLDSAFSINGSTIRGFFTTDVAWLIPTGPDDGSLAGILRIEPGIGHVTLKTGDDALLWVDVYGRQDVLDNTLADRAPSDDRPVFTWTSSGGGSFEEADIDPAWRNSEPDDRQVLFRAPSSPGTLTVETQLRSDSDCVAQQSDETAEEAEARCTAVLIVRVTRKTIDDPTRPVQPTPPVDPYNPAPPLEPVNPTPFDISNPEDGGTIFSEGASVEIDRGALSRGDFIWIRITPIGPASNEGKTWHRYTLYGTEYEVTVVDASGVAYPSFTFRKPVTICIPMYDDFRSDFPDVALIAIDDEGELTSLASIVRINNEGIHLCGAKSEFPTNVAAGGEGSPPPSEALVEEEYPDTGGSAPPQVIIIITMLLGITATIVGLTLWRRLRRRPITGRSV